MFNVYTTLNDFAFYYKAISRRFLMQMDARQIVPKGEHSVKSSQKEILITLRYRNSLLSSKKSTI